MPNFDEALQTFLSLWREKKEEYRKKHLSNLPPSRFILHPGRRFVKVSETDHLSKQEFVVAFIEKSTGDIYKAASWRAPAKHARGNIFSEENGQEAISPNLSINYLK